MYEGIVVENPSKRHWTQLTIEQWGKNTAFKFRQAQRVTERERDREETECK